MLMADDTQSRTLQTRDKERSWRAVPNSTPHQSEAWAVGSQPRHMSHATFIETCVRLPSCLGG